MTDQLREAIRTLGRMWARSQLPAGSRANLVCEAADKWLAVTESGSVIIESVDAFVGEFGLRCLRHVECVTPERATTILLNMFDQQVVSDD